MREEQTVPMSLHGSVVTTLTDWEAPDPAQDSLRHAVLGFVVARPDACRRACVPGHVTASALVLDHTGTETLLTLHPRLGRWVQLGGHCEDGDADILAALASHRVRLQSSVGREVRAKKTPILSFKPDETIRAAERIERILHDKATMPERPPEQIDGAT